MSTHLATFLVIFVPMGDTTETTVVTNTTEGEDPSVLAQAAVASAALSGAAAVKAGDASDTADEANLRAEGAQATANAALSESASKPNEEETRRIAREEAAATIAALVSAASEKTADPSPDPAGSVDPQVLPPSVAKANGTGPSGERKHKSKFASWYYGEEE